MIPSPTQLLLAFKGGDTVATMIESGLLDDASLRAVAEDDRVVETFHAATALNDMGMQYVVSEHRAECIQGIIDIAREKENTSECRRRAYKDVMSLNAKKLSRDAKKDNPFYDRLLDVAERCSRQATELARFEARYNPPPESVHVERRRKVVELKYAGKEVPTDLLNTYWDWEDDRLLDLRNERKRERAERAKKLKEQRQRERDERAKQSGERAENTNQECNAFARDDERNTTSPVARASRPCSCSDSGSSLRNDGEASVESSRSRDRQECLPNGGTGWKPVPLVKLGDTCLPEGKSSDQRLSEEKSHNECSSVVKSRDEEARPP